MFEEVAARVSFPDAERDVLAFWEDRDIAGKALANRAGAPNFVFFEGPPTANGLPHPGHCLTRVVKDVFPRYKTMRGFRCRRRAGWDTHGLPVEVEVGKQLGLSSKEDIERYGVEPFIHRCVESVFRYTREWEDLTRRLGYWVDMADPYVTYHQSYVESVWWSLKSLFERGLLYQGHKVVWWWPQGGTALSSGEVGEGYRDTDDPSITVRFAVAQGQPWADGVPTSLLAWTTTPWTLPSNVALAVGAELDYVVLEHAEASGQRERFILAAELKDKVFAGLKLGETTEVGRLKGAELVGLRYEPIFKYAKPETMLGTKCFEVAVGDFVSLGAGTGIVHVAPAFGEDDYRFCREHGFGFLQLVGPDGKFLPSVTEFAGRHCKEADKDIIALLKERGVLLKREVYRHPYPFCPRAEQDPLIQYARKSWFIRTSQFKEAFLANNAATNWLPEHIREGRFGDFLRNNVDWALSRERYWGTPLPIWQCSVTGQMEAVGGYAELLAKPAVLGLDVWEKAKAANPELSDHLKVHKPYIDAVEYASPFAAEGRMRRVTEVIDCWYDSGAMPFAQWGFPHQRTDEFADQFPADFISEAIDQTRGWFYALVAIGTLMREELTAAATPRPTTEGKGVPFNACIVLGHLLGEDGKKLSKRLKNYRPPEEIFDKYGADAMRWYFCGGHAPWSTIRFHESAIQEAQGEFLIRLHNVYSFFVIYANIDGWTPAAEPGERHLLDRHILSELHRTIKFVTEKMDAFDMFAACGRIDGFVELLSNWYVRRSRERFWAAGLGPDKRAAHGTLHTCLTTLAKLLAPFVPFYAESLHRNLVAGQDPSSPESVHLCDWPAVDESLIDETLAFEGDLVREIVSVGRSARTDAKLKVRQPLSKVEVLLADARHAAVVERYATVIAEELNVKAVEVPTVPIGHVTFVIKPNLKTLGKRLGKDLPALGAALAKLNGAALRAELQDKGAVTVEVAGKPVELGPDDVMVTLTANAGYAAAQGKRVVVALATEVTPDLRLEGLARDLIRVIQALRKEANLKFTDRVVLGVAATGDLAAAVERHRDDILAETLADDLAPTALTAPFAEATEEMDGETVRVTLARGVRLGTKRWACLA